ncbi:MAG: mechanosensitive ion channel family protein [Spirochaetes bacterium]|nr:mechanosensitive ion channel family protein [Spirochaetota bacterium]
MEFFNSIIQLIQDSLHKILLTAGVIGFAIILYKIIQKAISARIEKKHLRKQEGLLIIKTGKWSISLVCIFAFVFIWEGNIQNFWVGITGFFGIVAIGFFAVWSILSNIVSGIVLLLIKSIQIGDEIQIIPENITGRIENITLFHVVLIDNKKRSTLIPNNLFIQKIVKITS